MTDIRPVLMVIDVQNGFITANSEPVVPVIAGLVRQWLTAGGDVIFSRYSNYAGSPYERLIGWYGLHGAPETDLVDVLVPLAEHPRSTVIDKTVYTALTSQVREVLAEGGYTDLLVCGIATDGCVLKTVLDAFESGFTPWVLADACASNASRVDPAEVHRTALGLLARLVGAGQVISVRDAAAMLPAAAACRS
jgi:nicotinamidase-related amidase